jgi:hypothetical protein
MIFITGLGIILAAAMIVCLPLFRGVLAEDEAGAGDARAGWERQKREAYKAIKEADLDFQMGKLTAEDYEAIRGTEENRALEALSALGKGSAGGGARET